jgi:hypothetical protein
MYDTIKLNIETHNNKAIVNRLEKVKDSYDHESRLWIHSTGYLKNLVVKVNKDNISVNGSLNKFINGVNIYQLTRSGAKQGIEKLSDILGVSCDQASVWRIDVGDCFVMEKPVTEYLTFLQDTWPFDLVTYGNGNLLFKNNRRRIMFYDKLEEMKKNKENIPNSFQGSNVLRYELQFTKRLPIQFGEKIKAFQLYDQFFYSEIVNKWHQEYLKINRKATYSLEATCMPTPKATKNQLALYGMQMLGGDGAFLKMIKNNRDAGGMNNKNYIRHRNMIKSLTNTKAFIVPNDRILELDEKVKHAVELNLNV